MLALFSRILKLSGKYKGRIQGAFVCAFLESILAKMPIFLAFLVLSGFYQKTLTGTKCLYIGIIMLIHHFDNMFKYGFPPVRSPGMRNDDHEYYYGEKDDCGNFCTQCCCVDYANKHNFFPGWIIMVDQQKIE